MQVSQEYREWEKAHLAKGGFYETIVNQVVKNMQEEGYYKKIMVFFEIKKEK